MSASTKVIQAAAGAGGGFDENTPIGTETNGGFFAGIIDTTASNIIAGDFWQSGQRYALIVSPQSLQANAKAYDLRGNDGAQRIPPAETRWDGLSATNYIIAAFLDVTFFGNDAFEAFHHIDDIRTSNPVPDDGGSDWYLPAMDELELIYRNLKPTTDSNSVSSLNYTTSFLNTVVNFGYNPSSDPQASAYTTGSPSQTSVSAFQSGGSEAMSQQKYWSVTDMTSQNQGNIVMEHYFVGSFSGRQSPRGKDSDSSVRPVRRIVL